MASRARAEGTDRRIVLEKGVIDLDTGNVAGVRLSPTELKLLAYLVEEQSTVVSKQRLLAEVWGATSGATVRTLYTTVDRLRKKIERDPRSPRHVLAVDAQGYMFVPAGPVASRSGPAASRAAVLAEALAALRNEPERGLALIGPAGIGKTHLAARIARAMATEMPGGAHLCDLSGSDDAASVVAAVARGAGLPLAGPSEPGRQLSALGLALRERGPALIVLDGVTEAAGRLLEGWRALRPALLLTGRREGAAAGARVVSVGGLPQDEAIALFASRLALGRPRRAILPGERSHVEAIVALSEGVPAVVELAGLWTQTLAPAEIERRLREVRPGCGEAHPEHPLIEPILWGLWEGLEEIERRLLAGCAVFSGGFDAEAAEAVLPGEPGEVLARLEGFAAKGWVRPHAAQERLRMALRDSVRRFASARLAELACRQEICDRHRAHYGRLGAEAAERAVEAPLEAERWRRAEADNLRAAADGGASAPIRSARDRTSEGLAWLATALNRRGRHADAAAIFRRLLRLARERRAVLDEIRALTGLGIASFGLSRPGAARSNFEAARAICHRHGRVQLEVDLLARLGAADVETGRIDAGRARIEEALALARSAGLLERQASLHVRLARLSSQHDDPDRGSQHLASAGEICRALGKSVPRSCRSSRGQRTRPSGSGMAPGET